MIYFDNNATTPLLDSVRTGMTPYQTEQFGNPSSVHSLGTRARAALDQARKDVAGYLGVMTSEWVFTSGGSEANSLAIVGTLAHLFRAGRLAGRNVVISAIEHPAVREAAAWGCAAFGAELREVPICFDANGVMLQPFFDRIDAETALVSVMLAHNETGLVLPVATLFARARELGAVCHCDAVQALGKLSVQPAALGADLMTLSAHKAHGPKGVGGLYIRRGIKLEPLVHGGSQEQARRAGTENVAGIVGFQLAVQACGQHDPSGVTALRDRFEQRLLETMGDRVRINFQEQTRVGNTSSVQFRKQDGNLLLIKLDRAGVCISTGSACSSGALTPSKSLQHLGLSENQARASLRFSFSRLNTAEEVEVCVGLLAELV